MARSIRVGRRAVPMAVAVPVGVAVAIRLLFAYTDNVVGPDEAAYLGTGQNIWSGKGITYEGSAQLHFPPLLPALLGLLAKVLPEPHHATVLVTFVSSVAVVAIVGALAWRLAGRRAGVLALWIAALSPGLSVILARGTGGSEALYVAVMCGAALVAVGRNGWEAPPSLPRAAAVGALVGVAYLLRPEGVAIAAVLGVVLGVRAIGGRVERAALTTANLRRLTATGLACLAGLLVFAAPYVQFLHHHTGTWQLTAKSVDVNIEAWRALAGQDRLERDKHLYRLDDSGLSTEQEKHSLTALAREHPREYFAIVGENVAQLYKSLLSPNTTSIPGWRLFALPLFPFAVFAIWRFRSRPTTLAVGGVLTLSLATVAGFFVLNRYLPPVIAALSVFAGAGLAQLEAPNRRRWVALGLVTSVMSLATYFEGPHGPQLVREPPDLQVATRWLREVERLAPRARVMTRSTSVTYYLPDNAVVVPPVGTVDEVWRYARFNKVRYFIFDHTTQLWREALASLADGRDHREVGFEKLHSFRVEDRRTFIFKVVARD